MSVISNVVVGKAEGHPSESTRAKEVRVGRSTLESVREVRLGKASEGKGAHAGGRRSTGINAKGREPIDPAMPRLTPA